jgi:hypothetical protein
MRLPVAFAATLLVVGCSSSEPSDNTLPPLPESWQMDWRTFGEALVSSGDEYGAAFNNREVVWTGVFQSSDSKGGFKTIDIRMPPVEGFVNTSYEGISLLRLHISSDEEWGSWMAVRRGQVVVFRTTLGDGGLDRVVCGSSWKVNGEWHRGKYIRGAGGLLVKAR